jgi:hypothetical protein
MPDIVYTGQEANDGTGDPLRVAFQQINQNFVQQWSDMAAEFADQDAQIASGLAAQDAEIASGLAAQDAEIERQFNEAGMLLVRRGEWASGVAYEATPKREWVTSGGQAYVAASNHISGATFAADLEAGRWLAVDVAQLISSLAGGNGAEQIGFRPSIIGAVTRTLAQELSTKVCVSRFFNPTDTHAAPAFQRAIDALALVGGGTLEIPDGNYVFESRVTRAGGFRLAIKGASRVGVKLISNNADGIFDFDISGDGTRIHNHSVSNVTFSAAIPNAGTAYKLTEALGGNRHERMFVCDCVHVLAEDFATQYFTRGIDLFGVWRPLFIDTLITGPYTSVTDKQAMSVGISVDECYSPEFFTTQVWNCVEGISYDSTSNPGPEGFWMHPGCKVVDCVTCISISSAGAEPNAQLLGVHLNGINELLKVNKWKFIRLTGCLLYGQGGNTTYLHLTDVTEVRTIGNQFHFPSLDANTNIGISLLGSCNRFTSVNDYFNRFQNTAIRISSGSSNVKIIDPDFENCTNEVIDLSNTATVYKDSYITSFGDGSSAGPDGGTFRDSESPAANDVLGRDVFDGRNSAGGRITYAQNRASIVSEVEGLEDGEYAIFVRRAGVLTRALSMRAGVQVGLPAGGDRGAGTLNIQGNSGLMIALNSGSLGVFAGTGSPEGVVTASRGSTFHRTDGGAGTSYYVKESGTGNTGWAAK